MIEFLVYTASIGGVGAPSGHTHGRALRRPLNDALTPEIQDDAALRHQAPNLRQRLRESEQETRHALAERDVYREAEERMHQTMRRQIAGSKHLRRVV